MYISSIKNNFYISFKSHSKRVRDAEQIMRKSQEAFPMISPTRITSFHDRLHISVEKKVMDKVSQMQNGIYAMRDDADHKKKLLKYSDNPFLAHIEGIQKVKLGNCFENALAAAVGLSANGYNADVATLYVTHTYTNKKTKEIEYKEGAFLDHAFAVSDMGEDTRNLDEQVILDPWFGICGTWGEIKSNYHELFANDSDLEQFKNNNKAEFINQLKSKGSSGNISDYEERIGFIYYPSMIGDINREKAKRCLREKFPQLILNA